jgi:hypothetical protein
MKEGTKEELEDVYHSIAISGRERKKETKV